MFTWWTTLQDPYPDEGAFAPLHPSPRSGGLAQVAPGPELPGALPYNRLNSITVPWRIVDSLRRCRCCSTAASAATPAGCCCSLSCCCLCCCRCCWWWMNALLIVPLPALLNWYAEGGSLPYTYVFFSVSLVFLYLWLEKLSHLQLLFTCCWGVLLPYVLALRRKGNSLFPGTKTLLSDRMRTAVSLLRVVECICYGCRQTTNLTAPDC